MTEQKKTILVVDDDPDALEQVTLILEAGGFEVLSAPCQAEGEEMLLTVEPDLAIFDLMMEEKDSGFVLSHTAKKMYPDLKVIILTAVSAETGITFAADTPSGRAWIGAELMLDKPARSEELLAAVRRLLKLAQD